MIEDIDIKEIINKIVSNIPEKENEYLQRFTVMCLRCFSLEDVVEMEDKNSFGFIFYTIINFLKNKEYDKARETMGNYLMKLQMRRDFGPTLFSYTKERSKKIQKIMNKKCKR